MKKLITLLLLFPIFTCKMQAQEVYNILLEEATRTVNNPASGFTQTRIAQFKLTSLTYLKQKAFEKQPEVNGHFLDTQAYYMSEFLALFFKEIIRDKKQSEEKKKKKILLFIDASISNPLFGDTDKATTLAYLEEDGELTPFSLDTDWEKAYAAVKDNL